MRMEMNGNEWKKKHVIMVQWELNIAAIGGCCRDEYNLSPGWFSHQIKWYVVSMYTSKRARYGLTYMVKLGTN
jgi:hypothetical protein